MMVAKLVAWQIGECEGRVYHWLMLELRSTISTSSFECFWNSGNTYFRVDSTAIKSK